MKFIITLLVLIMGAYFGADHLLSAHLSATAPTSPADEKALVQNMAKFLENSPDLQKKITDSGQVIANPTIPATPATPATTTTQAEVDLSKISRYFGSKPADEYFKKYFAEKKMMHPENQDEQAKVFIEMSAFIIANPKDSVESLENALLSIPDDMASEREVLTPPFIHSAINFLDNLEADDSTKKAYLKRFIDNTQDPKIRDAFESHFTDLLLSPPPNNQ